MDTLYKKILFLGMLILVGQLLLSQEKISKNISKEYPMSNVGTLRLENKYGDINLYGWDRKNISITVSITVMHKKKENAEDLLKRINPSIQQLNDFVEINFEIADKSESFFTKYFNKANPFDFDRSNVQVNYTIYMPLNAKLDVTNKFGHVFLEDWKGALNANIEHGDLWISENLNKADIEMKYGKVRAASINYGNIDIKNGDLDINESKNLRINSSGTEIGIKNATSLELFSSKDEVNLEEVGTIYGNLKFTNVTIERLQKEIDLTMKITDFKVMQILNSDVDISIVQESSDISLNISKFPHKFNATLEEGLLRLPKTFKNVNSTVLDKGKKVREITADYGNKPLGSISIKGLKGVVLLRE